jgi:hypothetical protein
MMFGQKNRRKRCDIRSECKAKGNRQFYERLLSDDREYLTIKRDPNSGKYKLARV